MANNGWWDESVDPLIRAFGVESSLIALLLCFLVFPASRSQAQSTDSLPGRVRLTMVDEPVIHYATFQSHNQKVAEGGG